MSGLSLSMSWKIRTGRATRTSRCIRALAQLDDGSCPVAVGVAQRNASADESKQGARAES
jgi:hypothetical protein